jgi:hypothetical protein
MVIGSMDGYPPIQLAWRQKVAAFWSIFWLPTIAWFFLVTVLPFDKVAAHPVAISWAGHLLFFLAQAIIIRRLIRKKYATFRVAVMRDGAPAGPTLSGQEAVQVAMRVALPQILFLVLMSLLAGLLSRNPDPSVSKALSTISLWGRVLAVGPYSVQYGLNAKYRKFELQAFGQRYI